ncbi:hypothetical protein [Variovorax sp. DAIF25]|uniref:hypothetical protein n=1 Tax=Variovorax sp. DAIF25 TaxID=3080983 RepID=UPI003D6BB985
MVVNRNSVRKPVLPQQIEPCEPLGGDVVVRGLLMSERMALDDLNEKAAKPLEGESEEQARTRAGKLIVPRMLNACVVDDEGMPVLSMDEWDVFGGAHRRLTFHLFGIALRLSGRDPEAVKKN